MATDLEERRAGPPIGPLVEGPLGNPSLFSDLTRGQKFNCHDLILTVNAGDVTVLHMTTARRPSDSLVQPVAERALTSGRWVLPCEVWLDGELVRWRWPNRGRGLLLHWGEEVSLSGVARRPRELLIRFVDAAKSGDEAIADMVREFGPLRQNGIARRLRPKDWATDHPAHDEEAVWWNEADPEDDDPNFPTDDQVRAMDRHHLDEHSEPIAFWRDFAHDVGVLINSGKRDPIPVDDLRTVARRDDHFRWNPPFGPWQTRMTSEPWEPLVPRGSDVEEFVTRMAEQMLDALPVELTFDDGRFGLGPSCLASALGLELAHWTRDGLQFAVCDICGDVVNTPRRPMPGRRFVCTKPDCGKRAAALRKRDERERRKGDGAR